MAQYHLCLIVLIFFASLSPNLAMQGGADLTITPQQTISNGQVVFTCYSRLPSINTAAMYFKLLHGSPGEANDVASQDLKCYDLSKNQPDIVSLNSFTKPGYSIKHTACDSVTVTVAAATRAMAGKYYCTVQHVQKDFSQSAGQSIVSELGVGDATPSVSRFNLAVAASGAEVPNEGQVAAGTNLSLTCETGPAEPLPEFTISADGARLFAVRPAAASPSQVVLFSQVPKTPRVLYRCSVDNGFGTEQSAESVVNVVYGAVHTEVSIPKEVSLQTTEEILICSVANNPPRRLTISGLKADLLQPGYPRYEEKDGYSRVYVKLKEGASTAKELEFTCGTEGMEQPAKAAVQLLGVKPVTTQGPSSAMMTIGIVVAGVVVFVVVIAVIVVVLKRRSSANKPSNGDNTRYGRVNQNDADGHLTYESNPAGKMPIKVCDTGNEPQV